MQANLLSGPKSFKKGLRWGYSDKRAFKSGENVSFVFKFFIQIFPLLRQK